MIPPSPHEHKNERLVACKCGCGQTVKRGRKFVDKEHQLAWMHAGGASEMNAQLPHEVRVRGGQTAGIQARENGRLYEAAIVGGARSREIARAFHERDLKRSGDDPIAPEVENSTQ